MTRTNGKKVTYYVWRNDNGAGIATDWSECESHIKKKGGRCLKKFNSEEQAKELLNQVFEDIRLNTDSEEEERLRSQNRLTNKI